MAANDEYTSGFIYPESGLSIYYLTTGYNLDVLSGYFPASFTSESLNSVSIYGRSFGVVGDALPRPAGTYTYNLLTDSQFYIEVLFSVPAMLSFDLNNEPSGSTGYVSAKLGLGSPDNLSGFDASRSSADISFVVDDTLYPLNPNGNNFIPAFGSYDVDHFFGYRFYFNPLSIQSSNSIDLALKLYWNEGNVSYNFSDPNYLGSINQNVTVNTGILQDINGTLKEIQTSTTQIEADLSSIKDTVSDTHDQLENPNSNIWQAAGSAISGAIESLFVPSEQDIANVKQGFDDLAQDKLGGAYTAMETVEDTITQVNDKLNNPSAAEGVEFPGIAVPLGGEVGTVVLAERQMVTLPMELTAILHPLGGTIISIIAGLGTFNVLKDMVECFLSGFSYAEYLHRNKGGSDE